MRPFLELINSLKVLQSNTFKEFISLSAKRRNSIDRCVPRRQMRSKV